ncbi:MAG TPA: ribosomal protein S18-alanine N-acetyltransferase [Mycobacteriales bacterium]|nr:ribosomal protein S18-alanine N-acetyltransferase [Mycobacteriales bacterium]
MTAPPGGTGPAGLVIVPMRWWHLAAVMQAERELFGVESWSEAAFWSELAQPESRYYIVAEDPAQPAGERFVGYGGLGVIADEAHVLVLGVRKDQQRRGVGTALLRDLLAAAADRGAGTVLLDVRADNPAAQRLYARHGFVPTGIRKRYYQPSGTDAVVMVRHG